MLNDISKNTLSYLKYYFEDGIEESAHVNIKCFDFFQGHSEANKIISE